MIRLIRRMLNLPPRPCHVEWTGDIHNPRLRWSLAVCITCGKLHAPRPRLSDRAIDEVIGGKS